MQEQNVTNIQNSKIKITEKECSTMEIITIQIWW